jgi:hypothetical protein
MTLVYKLLSNGGGGDMFTKAGITRSLGRDRQPYLMGLPTPMPDIRKYSFASRKVERWNSLPDGARAAESQQAFKALLKPIRCK